MYSYSSLHAERKDYYSPLSPKTQLFFPAVQYVFYLADRRDIDYSEDE